MQALHIENYVSLVVCSFKKIKIWGICFECSPQYTYPLCVDNFLAQCKFLAVIFIQPYTVLWHPWLLWTFSLYHVDEESFKIYNSYFCNKIYVFICAPKTKNRSRVGAVVWADLVCWKELMKIFAFFVCLISAVKPDKDTELMLEAQIHTLVNLFWSREKKCLKTQYIGLALLYAYFLWGMSNFQNTRLDDFPWMDSALLILKYLLKSSVCFLEFTVMGINSIIWLK